MIKPTISIIPVVDRGFFLEDGQWTYYRRNYFSCTCSLAIDPLVDVSDLRLIEFNGEDDLKIRRLAIGVSALVNGSPQKIDLVQRNDANNGVNAVTPPEIQFLNAMPKEPEESSMRRKMYHDYGEQPHRKPLKGLSDESLPIEHTFERLQLGSAAKRDALQSFELIFDAFADVSGQSTKQRLVPIARARSVKIRVRDRSPTYFEAMASEGEEGKHKDAVQRREGETSLQMGWAF